jgi:alcohol/geraniol dehydrogenase (NADP+)
MSAKIKAYAALSKGAKLQPFEFDPGPLGDDQVEIKVAYCGICHSDLSMVDNEWGWSAFPLVPGHEAVGTIVEVGDHVKHLKAGQVVGLGWYANSCLFCPQCMGGDHNLCLTAQATIIGRHGGFADRVRCQAAWAVPLPEKVSLEKAGPLFCAGITVFNPMVQFGVKATDRVGVIGIGGLGHLALQFLNKWGCEVYAFTSSDSKKAEAIKLGAHATVNSRDPEQLKKAAGSLNYIISTVNVGLDWSLYLKTLAPKGRLHFVGASVEPIGVVPVELLAGQYSMSGSPMGSPATLAKMLEFCGRHNIAPVTENFPMSRVNEAFDHLRAGKARYRIVLSNDLK